MSAPVVNTRLAYGRLLAEMWAAHLAPAAADAPTVVSTFAGAGGSSLGYSMAGYRELLAVEWDDHAAATFARNFPHVPLHHGDISHFDPASLGLEPGELDVFDGSPPCQGFSVVGRRQVDDPRNQLFRQYIRLLEHWQPKAFVMENVAGMVKGKMRTLFAEILQTLKQAGPGYRVVARLMDASYFQVPQRRQRMIFVGVRADLGVPPVHPAAVARPITVREALADLTDPGPFQRPSGKAARVAPLIPPGRNGGDTLVGLGGRRAFFSLERLAWDRPSYTLIKEISASRNGLLHPDEDRLLGIRELARLQSFPDEFDWGDSPVDKVWMRLGNSVPPLMMRAIAQTLREKVL
ncbi:DNA cytosine methyltransferase [Streptomyces sp. H27-C3]|uniref:DNA cytosine methyltransferase n=1 Tax=Streptomyces sp. H27-C3 TaxID=3046305 RepID=UPI0024B9AAF6|nr:DNA cytosine methyltransferase [Streptomyces sp. H27-C3]MDJ0465012.1 DNA cytosine methyltransferase [Streptomyces sp. H27-C3]